MEQNKLSVVLNLSSQANMKNTKNSVLSQYNYVVILNASPVEKTKNGKHSEKFRVLINIKKSGEIIINGISEEDINNENIKIYTDKKETVSENNEES